MCNNYNWIDNLFFSYTSYDMLWGFASVVGMKDSCTWVNSAQEFIRFLGETLISAEIISLIMSIHTIQETHQKVRDNLLLDDPSFIERYTEEETNRLLRYSTQQKFLLNICTKHNNVLDTFTEDLPKVFSPMCISG